MTGSRPGADPPGSFVDEFNSVLYWIALLLHPEEQSPERLQGVRSTLHHRVDELGLERQVQEKVDRSLAVALRELGSISELGTNLARKHIKHASDSLSPILEALDR
jgi:hypothetical protein